MSRVDPEKIFKEDLMLKPGLGATRRVGSDSYAYYVTEVELPVVGLYSPRTWFERDWTDGTEKVEEFDPSRKADFWIKRFRGKWYEYDKTTGKRGGPFPLSFGCAYSYRDPSF